MKRLDAMKGVLDSLQPTKDEAKEMFARAKSVVSLYEQRIQLSRTTRAELEAKLNANPQDGQSILLYAQKVSADLSALVYSSPDRAEEGLKTATAFLDGLRAKVTEDPAKKALEGADQALVRLQGSIDAAKRRAELAGLSRAELEAKLNANPDDMLAISVYGQKVYMELGQLASSDAAGADEGWKSAKAFLDGLRAKVKDEMAKKILENADQTLMRAQGAIERAKRLAALVGKDATPLEVEAWVNGTPLTEADLKGKVVLLDFWAVWCGPCIATFPHLREWQEKYADKGLVVVGLTNYYNFTWDDAAGRPARAQGQEKVAPEKEREMLVKFAAHHNLHHRFAIQKDKTLAEYYAVTGIPHVVLIDREGKIRLIRVGSGDKNAKDIQEMLEKLLAGGV
jgi:thiol-disulfide isomerase/thioredoxin